MATVPPLLNRREVAHLRDASQAAARTLALVGSRLAAGQTTADIDRWVSEDTARQGGTPSQLGYHGFPAAVCVSRNEVVCHGIPSASEHLQAGDIVNVDVTTALRGFHGDTSATFVIGAPSSDARRLVDGARGCLLAGISVVRAGAFLGDIGAAIGDEARRAGLSVVTEWAGHGIGRAMHLPPSVPHVGRKDTGPKLLAGMAFTIEPMVNLGGPHVGRRVDGGDARRPLVRAVRAHHRRHRGRLRGPHRAPGPAALGRSHARRPRAYGWR
jgi:methionyl aminopeptidase